MGKAHYCALYKQTIRAILATGKLLLEARTALKHGEFASMIESLPFGRRTAERLISIAANPVLSNATHVSHLPASWGTLYVLSKLPKQTLLARLADGTVHPALERFEAEQWALAVHRKTTAKSELVTVKIMEPPPQAPVRHTIQLVDKNSEADPELREIECQVRENDTSGYEHLLAAWEAASTDARTRFLTHIGARLLS
jgi:hypothetical protein